MAEYMERLGPQRLLNLETRIALYQAERAIQSALSTLSGLTSNLMRTALYSVEGTPVARPGGHMLFLEGLAAPNLPVARLEAIANALQSLSAAEAALRALPNPFGMPLTAASVRSFLNTLNMAQNAIGQAEQVLPALFNLANEGFWREVGIAPQKAMNLLALGQLVSGTLTGLGRAQLGQITTGIGGPLSLTRSLGGTHIFQGPAANFLRLGNEINESVRSALQALQALNVNAFREALERLNVDLAQFMSNLPSIVSALGPFEAAQLALMAGQLGVPNAARALQGINNALRLYVDQTASVITDTLSFAQWLQQGYRTLEGLAYQPFLGGASYYGQPQSIGQAYEVPLARPINTGPGAYGLTETTITTVGINASPQAVQAAQTAGLDARLGTLALGIYSASSDYMLQLGNRAAQLNQAYNQLLNAWNNYINAVNSGNYGEAPRALQELMTNYGQVANAINAINNLVNQIASSAAPYLQQFGNTLSQELGEALGRVSSQVNALNNLLSSSDLSALLVGSLSVSPTGQLSPQIVVGTNRVNLFDFIRDVRQLQLNAQNYVGQLNNIISVLQNARDNPVQALSYGISLLSGGAQGIANITNGLNTLSAQLSFAVNTLSEYVNAGRARISIANLPAEIESGLAQLSRLFADLGVDFRNFISGLASGNFIIGLRSDLSHMDRLIANMGLNLSSMRMIDMIDTMATFNTLAPMVAPVAGARLLSQSNSLVNEVDAFISGARSLLARVQAALSEGLSLAQVGGSNAWVTLYDTLRTAIYDLLRGMAIGIGTDAQLLGQALGNIPQLRDASSFLISRGNWLINWRPPESIVNAAASMLAYSVPVVGPLSHLAAYWNQESDLDKLFDIVMAGLSAFFMFDALDNFAAGFYRSLADMIAQEARASGGTIDVMSFLAQNPSVLARAFSAGIETMLNGGVIQNLPGLLTVLKNIAVSVGFSEAFTLGMAAAEHRLSVNDLTTLLLSGAMLGILTYAMSAALGITEEAALNYLANPSLRSAFQDALTSVLTRFGDVLGISADEAAETAANVTNSLFRVLSSSAFRAIATSVLEFNNAGLINAGIAYAAANGRLSREQLWNYYLQGVLYGALFFAGTQYFVNLIATLKGINALLVDVYEGTPVEASPAGFRDQLSFFDAVKASILTAFGVPADEALRLVLSDRVVLLRGTIFGFDPDEVKSAADALYGPGNYKLFLNTLPNDRTIAFAIPSVQAFTDQVTEMSADQLTDPDVLAMFRANAPNLVNVLLPEKSTDVLGVSKFYYITTRLDLLGGDGGLGKPIEAFNNVDDLLTFLRSVQDPEDYMVITDGNRFMVYQRSLYMITPDQLSNPDVLAMFGTNTNRPGLVNVLLYEGPTGPNDTPKFYYFVTRLDLLGGSEGLGDPIATFNNPNDLLTFLRSAQNYGDYMVITDGNTFMVYPRSLYEIPASQLGSPDILAMFRAVMDSNTTNVLMYEEPTSPSDQPRLYYFVTRLGLLGGDRGLGDPIATFNNPGDLLRFLSTAQDPEDLMILTDGTKFMVYPRDFYMPQVDSGRTLVIVDNDSMGRLLTMFNLIRSGGVPGGGEVDVLNRQPVFLLRDPAGNLVMAIGYDSLAKPISVADMMRLMLGEGVNPSDVGEVVSVHATATPPAEPSEEFSTLQAKATPYRTAAANNFYLAPGLLVRGAVVQVADDGTIEDVASGPSWLRLGYYFYLGARNESLVSGVPGRGYFIEVRKIPLVDPTAAGNLSFADVLGQWEQTVNQAYRMGTVVQATPYENILVLRGRVPGLYPEYQTYISAAGEVPYYISVPRTDPSFYRFIGMTLDPTGGNARYVEIIDSDGNVIASGRVDNPADLGRFIIENADRIQPGYVIQVSDASPDNALNFLANGTWYSVYVDNSLATQLKDLANGGNLAISMFNESGAPAFRWGVALYNMEGGEAGITQAFVPDVRIGGTTVTLGVEFDRPLSQDEFRAFIQALLNAVSPDDVVSTFSEYGARIDMARIGNSVMFFSGEAVPDGETFVNTLLTGGVKALSEMASNVVDLSRWANNDIGAYTLWIGRQIEGGPTVLNPTEVANLRFLSWANGGSPYLNATLYNADTDSFYNFYMRPGANIGLGEEVQENGMYYSGAYGLVSELSNIGRGSPSPWGEVANFLGRLAGELLYGLTGNYVPVGVVLGTQRGTYVPRTDVFLSQGIEGTPRAVMAMEGLQTPMEEAQAALARPLAYIAPSAVMAQLSEGARVSAAQPVALESIERAVPALRSLDNMVATLLQLGTVGVRTQAVEALQAERGGALALPQFSEALRQLQVRNVQPGQALTAEIVTPQVAPLEQANFAPRETGPAAQQLGQVQQVAGQEALQLGRQIGQLGQAQRGYAVQPAQQLAQPIAELQLARAGQEVRIGQPQVRLGQAQQVIGQAVQAELGQARVVQPQVERGYEAQPYGQVEQGYEAQPAQQTGQAEQVEQAQGYQAQPYGREQARTERLQVFQQPRQVQLYQPQPYQVQPYQPQVGYRTGYQPGQQPGQQPTQQAQQGYEQVQQELQQQLEQAQEQTPIPPPYELLSILYTQPTAPWWFRFNRAPERRAYLKEVLAL
jgi:hypothetical protein